MELALFKSNLENQLMNPLVNPVVGSGLGPIVPQLGDYGVQNKGKFKQKKVFHDARRITT